MKILLNENIQCSSFATNGTDFNLSPAAASITSASSAACLAGSNFSNLFNLNFSNPLPPGNYTLSVVNGSDGNTMIDNCNNVMAVGTSINFTVNQAITASVTTQFGCAGTPSGLITATANGGTSPFTYKINSGTYTSNNVFSGLTAGTYTISIKDQNGCVDDTIVNLVAPQPMVITSVVLTNLSCYGANTGSVTVNASGGNSPYTYSVNAAAYSTSNTISNLGTGNYIVHVKDVNGCVKDTVIFISSPGPLFFLMALQLPIQLVV